MCCPGIIDMGCNAGWLPIVQMRVAVMTAAQLEQTTVGHSQGSTRTAISCKYLAEQGESGPPLMIMLRDGACSVGGACTCGWHMASIANAILVPLQFSGLLDVIQWCCGWLQGPTEATGVGLQPACRPPSG
jgi:hypothetical protein